MSTEKLLLIRDGLRTEIERGKSLRDYDRVNRLQQVLDEVMAELSGEAWLDQVARIRRILEENADANLGSSFARGRIVREILGPRQV